MNPLFQDAFAQLPVSALLLLLAAVAVVAGAPLFAAGWRALRMRRAAAGLAVVPLDGEAAGLVTLQGRVALESPMFAPLSGRPCAGFTLEVAGDGMRVGASMSELRAFRLVGEQATARVVVDHTVWHGAVTERRTIAPLEALPERLAGLLEQSAEVRWLRDQRVALQLTERALEVGAEVFVTGVARGSGVAQVERGQAQVFAMVESIELAATGTDGMAWTVGDIGDIGDKGNRSSRREPELWIESGEPLGQLLVTPEAPAPAVVAPPLWKLTLMLLGPAFTLAGLLYLARVVAPLIVGRL